MSSLRKIAIAGVGLLGTVAALTACAGDGQQGIPTETPEPPTTTSQNAAPIPTTTTPAPPTGPTVGAVPGDSQATSALSAFLTDLDTGGVDAVAQKCFTVPPNLIPVEYADVSAVLDAAAQPGTAEADLVTWTGPISTLSIARDEIASGYACPRVHPTGTEQVYTDLDAVHTVARYVGRFTGAPADPADLEGDYPVVCGTDIAWDAQGTGSPTAPPLANNPGRLTESASYNPDSVYVAYSNAAYTTVYADVTNVSGFQQNQIFTLTRDGSGFCIGDVA